MMMMTATRDRIYSDRSHAEALVASLRAGDDGWRYELAEVGNGYSIEVFDADDLLGYL